MSTKDQERQALEKIREILGGLGEDSYLVTAFEGCLDDAETNIENDWALSMNGRWQDAEQKIEALKADLIVANKNNDLLRESIDAVRKRAEESEALYNQEQGIADGLRDKWHTAQDQAHELADMCAERDLRMGGLEEEIVHLKAKLYDMMTGA